MNILIEGESDETPLLWEGRSEFHAPEIDARSTSTISGCTRRWCRHHSIVQRSRKRMTTMVSRASSNSS